MWDGVTGLILPAQLHTPVNCSERHGGFDKGFTQRIFDRDMYRPVDPLFPSPPDDSLGRQTWRFRRRLLRRLRGFDPAVGAGTFAGVVIDLAAFFRVSFRGIAWFTSPEPCVAPPPFETWLGLGNQA